MVIVDTKKDHVFVGVSKKQASDIIGVNRATILRWEKKRKLDGTFKEVFNHYTIYFRERVTSYAKCNTSPSGSDAKIA